MSDEQSARVADERLQTILKAVVVGWALGSASSVSSGAAVSRVRPGSTLATPCRSALTTAAGSPAVRTTRFHGTIPNVD